jgi:hypothetical protein
MKKSPSAGVMINIAANLRISRAIILNDASEVLLMMILVFIIRYLVIVHSSTYTYHHGRLSFLYYFDKD